MTVADTRKKPRLSRLVSVYQESAVFFITFCTHERRPLLANDAMHRAFQVFCSQALTRGVIVGRYVLMLDYLHFRLDQIAEEFLIKVPTKTINRAASLAERLLRSSFSLGRIFGRKVGIRAFEPSSRQTGERRLSLALSRRNC